MTTKRKAVVRITVLVAVVISLIVIAFLLANSGFDFVGYLKKLHGG